MRKVGKSLRPLPSPLNVVNESGPSHGHGISDLAAVSPNDVIYHTSRDRPVPLFADGVVPLTHQASDAEANFNKRKGHSHGSMWLRESALVQQALPCRQFVYTPRCFLITFFVLGAIFLAVSISKIIFCDFQLTLAAGWNRIDFDHRFRCSKNYLLGIEFKKLAL